MKTIFIDMDGVLCDFEDGYLEVLNMPYESHEVDAWDFYKKEGISRSEFYAAIELSGRHFWENLKPYSWTSKLLEVVKKNRKEAFPCILTSPMRHPECYSGKRQWIIDHAPWIKSFLGTEKYLLAGPDRLLIDDKDENCEKWVKHGGEAFLMPQLWNKSQHLIDRREELLFSRIDAFIGK